MKLKNLLLLFSLVALLMASGGCIFSPDDSGDDGGGDDGGGLQPARTTDLMMANFKTIYEGMMATEYASLLHDGYRTVLLQDTIDEWAGGDRPLADNYFDKTAEVRIHTNMFDNLTGLDPSGNLVPPIESIEVDLLERQGSWSQVDPSLDYFGQNYPSAYRCRYSVLIHFNLPGNSRLEVDQLVDFIAIKVGDNWQMLGQIGLN